MKSSNSSYSLPSRRQFLGRGLFGFGALALSGMAASGLRGATTATKGNVPGVPGALDFESETYPFELPPLPYGFGAMEPYIDARTMEIHYTKHHAGYVRKLNAALANHPELHGMTLGEMLTDLDSVPEEIRTAVRNNGGGHLNHCLFWYSLQNGPSNLSPELDSMIANTFGSQDALLDKMVTAGLGRFGSGWSWLCQSPEGTLVIISTPNQDSPWMKNPALRPLLGVDVWEHAYYLKYQNRRGDYLSAWKNIVNWGSVSQRFQG